MLIILDIRSLSSWLSFIDFFHDILRKLNGGAHSLTKFCFSPMKDFCWIDP